MNRLLIFANMFILIQDKKAIIASDMSTIAAIIGVSPSTISRWLNKGYHIADNCQIFKGELIRSKRGGKEFKRK